MHLSLEGRDFAMPLAEITHQYMSWFCQRDTRSVHGIWPHIHSKCKGVAYISTTTAPSPIAPRWRPPAWPSCLLCTICWCCSHRLLAIQQCFDVLRSLQVLLELQRTKQDEADVTCCAAGAALYNTAPHLERNCFLRPGVLFILQVRLEVF